MIAFQHSGISGQVRSGQRKGLCDAGETLEISNGGSCDMSSPVPGQACVLDADCAPGSCVPMPICNPLGL